jgi:hypothetical protein
MKVQGSSQNSLYSLIPLADFKAILGIDDREDCLDFASVRNQGCEFLQGKNSTTLFQPPSLAAFCLITATFSIEQYCKRRLLRRKNTDYLTFTGEYIFTLREYPVRKVLSVHAATAGSVQRGTPLVSPENLVDPKHYYCLPDEGIQEDLPFSLVLRPPFRLAREEMGVRVRYLAGPENFTVNGNSFWPHAMSHYSSTRSMFRVYYLAGYVPGKVPADLASACLELAAGLKTFFVKWKFS